MKQNGIVFKCPAIILNIANCIRYAYANPQCDKYLRIIQNTCSNGKTWIPDCEFYEMNKNLALKKGFKTLPGLNAILVKDIPSYDQHLKSMKFLKELDQQYKNKKSDEPSIVNIDKFVNSTHKIQECQNKKMVFSKDMIIVNKTKTKKCY